MEQTSGLDLLLSLGANLSGGLFLIVLYAVVRHFLRDARGARQDLEAERRAAQLEHEQRVTRLFPETRSLSEASRVRLDTLTDEFSVVEMLAFGQRAFQLQHGGGAMPATEGAIETLRAGPQPDQIEGVLPLSARLVSAEQSPPWRTIELELSCVQRIRIAGEQGLFHLSERWRMRLSSGRPLPGPDALTEPERAGWEILSVPLRERTRLDRLPPQLPPWGDPERRTPSAPHLEQRRAALVEGLSPSVADLEAHAGALALAALDGGAARFIDPLDAQLASEASTRALLGVTLHIEDLRVEAVAVVDAAMDARWRWFLARVELAAFRWLEPSGARPSAEERGVLLIGLARAADDPDGGWSGFGLWPGEKVPYGEAP